MISFIPKQHLDEFDVPAASGKVEWRCAILVVNGEKGGGCMVSGMRADVHLGIAHST